jgi:hypothetical protein
MSCQQWHQDETLAGGNCLEITLTIVILLHVLLPLLLLLLLALAAGA